MLKSSLVNGRLRKQAQRATSVLLGALALCAAGCGGSAHTNDATRSTSGSPAVTASERTQLLTQFRARQEQRGFSTEVATCLAASARRLPVGVLERGNASSEWTLVALTTSRCGPTSVKAFILRRLEREFHAQPGAFPVSYRHCIAAGVRHLPDNQVSKLIVRAVAGKQDLTTALTQIANKCRASLGL